MGERPEPRSGLRAYFEPPQRLKDINLLSGRATKKIPTAGPIYRLPAANTGLTIEIARYLLINR